MALLTDSKVSWSLLKQRVLWWLLGLLLLQRCWSNLFALLYLLSYWSVRLQYKYNYKQN